jgi:hypothetical protein
MGSLLRMLRRLLKLALFVSIVIGVIKVALSRKKPEVTGEASWPPLTDEPEPTPVPPTTSQPPEPVVAGPASEAPWVEPVDGQCPASHPIKGNAQSKIFHVPGGASYDRTVAERCYASADAAEADGFRAAKR